MIHVAAVGILVALLAATEPALAQPAEGDAREGTSVDDERQRATRPSASQNVARARRASSRQSAARPLETAQTTTELSRRIIDLSTGDPTDRLIAGLLKQTVDVPTPTEQELFAAIEMKPSPEQVALLWEALADRDNGRLATMPVLSALARASGSAKARDALWSALAAEAKAYPQEKDRNRGKSRSDAVRAERDASLVATFERQRNVLLPLLPPIRESEGAGDEIVNLMQSSTLFGDNIEASIVEVVARDAGAVARRIGRERDLGKRAKWEWDAFEALLAWKTKHVSASSASPARSLAELDARGETFITIMNNLHAFDPWFRGKMLEGLGEADVFNAVVGGETELYRMGTSAYRDHMHAVIMRGIRGAGSFEAFIAKAAPNHLAKMSAADATRRGMIFVRIASTFGLLEPVLETVKDRDLFVADAIVALGDPLHFELESGLVVDVVTGAPSSKAAVAFKGLLVDRLYAAHREARAPGARAVYGSILSVYQKITGNRREPSIDEAYGLDGVAVGLPFARLFTRIEGRHVHRMFMRFDQDTDAYGSYASFRATMRERRAVVSTFANHEVFRIYGNGRTIEIYANKPGETGVKRGIPAIAETLAGQRVETVVGRGHSSIIAPLQEDAKRVLGPRTQEVAAVIVGTCGGDAAVRKLIATFGYVPFVASKATGRQLINNAIVGAYVDALLDVKAAHTLSLADVLSEVTAEFRDFETREDAGFYRVALSTVMAAHLYENHVRRYAEPLRQAARQ